MKVRGNSPNEDQQLLAVDLRDASQWSLLPPSIHFQRRANDWLTRLRKSAQQSGLMPLHLGQTRLDVLDALRSVFNISNGAALANIAIAESALDAFPDRIVLFAENNVGSGFIDSIAELVTVTPRIRIQRQPAKSSWWPQLRAHGRLIRDAAAHRLGALVSSKSPRSDYVVLAVPRLPAHFADFVPVAHALRKHYGISTVIGSASPDIYALARRERLQAVPLRGSTTREIQSLLGTSKSKLPELIELIRNQQPEAGVVTDIENRTLVRETSRTLMVHYSSVIDVAVASTQAIVNVKPNLLTVGNPYTFEGRVSARVAQGMEIPTFALEHGSIFPNDPIWQECVVDKVCVWGNPSMRALISCGLTPKQIAITGGPRFDAVLHDDAFSNPNKHERRDYILVATSGAGDQTTIGQHRSFIRMLFEVADALPEASFVVKLHKKDRAEFYQSTERVFHPRVRVVDGQRSQDGLEIFEYLKRARGLITICSSAALDAMAMRVPVIAVDVWWPAAPIEGVEFLENGSTRKVRGVGEFVDAVRDVWQGIEAPSDALAKSYADDHFVNRGTAAIAVAKEMVSAINGDKIV